jgi:hypothetical protein
LTNKLAAVSQDLNVAFASATTPTRAVGVEVYNAAGKPVGPIVSLLFTQRSASRS